jgi:hypothetical protein
MEERGRNVYSRSPNSEEKMVYYGQAQISSK